MTTKRSGSAGWSRYLDVAPVKQEEPVASRASGDRTQKFLDPATLVP
jgi:hypothetical protein